MLVGLQIIICALLITEFCLVFRTADCHSYVCRAGNDEEGDLADSASDTCGAAAVSKDDISSDWKGLKIGSWTEKHMCFLNCKRSFWFKYNEACPSKMMVHIAHNSFSLCQLSLTRCYANSP